MRIVVASKNPVKIEAVETAFRAQFPGQQFSILPISVDSGVSDQPKSDSETRRGAGSRTKHAASIETDADFWVGLEGGVEVIEDQLYAFAWMAVRGKSGSTVTGRTTTLALPPQILKLMDQGLELGEANDRVFKTQNSKQRGGAFGLLTDGKFTRSEIYAQTLIITLVPFTKKCTQNTAPSYTPHCFQQTLSTHRRFRR